MSEWTPDMQRRLWEAKEKVRQLEAEFSEWFDDVLGTSTERRDPRMWKQKAEARPLEALISEAIIARNCAERDGHYARGRIFDGTLKIYEAAAEKAAAGGNAEMQVDFEGGPPIVSREIHTIAAPARGGLQEKVLRLADDYARLACVHGTASAAALKEREALKATLDASEGEDWEQSCLSLRQEIRETLVARGHWVPANPRNQADLIMAVGKALTLPEGETPLERVQKLGPVPGPPNPPRTSEEKRSIERWKKRHPTPPKPSPARVGLRTAALQAREAFRLTREYVGEKTLPAIKGWSWYDADQALEAALDTPEGACPCPEAISEAILHMDSHDCEECLARANALNTIDKSAHVRMPSGDVPDEVTEAGFVEREDIRVAGDNEAPVLASMRGTIRALIDDGSVSVLVVKGWADRLEREQAALTALDATAGECDREELGKLVRKVWLDWAREQPAHQRKPHWLRPWQILEEPQKEVDRRIGEAVYLKALAALVRTPWGDALADAWANAVGTALWVQESGKYSIGATEWEALSSVVKKHLAATPGPSAKEVGGLVDVVGKILKAVGTQENFDSGWYPVRWDDIMDLKTAWRACRAAHPAPSEEEVEKPWKEIVKGAIAEAKAREEHYSCNKCEKERKGHPWWVCEDCREEYRRALPTVASAAPEGAVCPACMGMIEGGCVKCHTPAPVRTAAGDALEKVVMGLAPDVKASGMWGAAEKLKRAAAHYRAATKETE